MHSALQVLVGLSIGYVLGSFSPAYILGRMLQGLDIRTVNYCNAGVRNVKKTLGLWPAVVTSIIDLGKGVAAMLLSAALAGVTGYALIAPAVGAVVGHIFPFYLGFRGGRGTATAIGVFMYIVATGIGRGAFPPLVLVGLLVGAGLIYLVTGSGDATALFAFLGMVIMSAVEFRFTAPGTTAVVMCLYIFVHAIFRGRDVGLYNLPEGVERPGWRAAARPLALLFVPLSVFMPRPWFIGLLSVLAGVALFLDGYRRVSKRAMASVYRKKEQRQISSISLFLVSVLLLFVLFKPEIASVALAFLTIGDLSGKLVGLRFGRRELLAGRTLEGSVAFFVGAATAGYTMARIFGEPALLIMLGGALAAAAIELLSMGMDDNLTVGLGSAGVLTLLALI